MGFPKMQNLKNHFFRSGVYVYHDNEMNYPGNAPYHPSEKYPEYPFEEINSEINSVYDGVRNLFLLMGLDKENYGNRNWDPLKEIVSPGNSVVIKPNFVASYHEQGGNLFSIITHPSVIRPVVDYVFVALKGRGKIIICDAPEMYCNFNELLDKTRLDLIKNFYKEKLNFDIEILDLRDFWVDRINKEYKGSGSALRLKLSGDPQGGVLINLGKKSLFYNVSQCKRFYGADFNRDETIRHHFEETQEYMVSKTILSADTVISIPKLKVHKKVGVTLNIKGLVGININKNCLVHFKLGSPEEGGDQYPDNYFNNSEKTKIKVRRWAYDKLLSKKSKFYDFLYEIFKRTGKFFYKKLKITDDKNKKVLDGGNWHGNDSAWRMACDLLRIFLFADEDGNIHEKPVRKVFSIVDGIIGGEGDGPLAPDEKKCGLLISGYDLFLVDMVCTRLMGFDFKRIKMLNYIDENSAVYCIDKKDFKIITNDNNLENFDFKPPSGWKDYLKTKI